LQIVLAIGNLVNGNTNRGGAWGFKLASLLKLLDTKSGVRNWTLMNFLANEIDSKYPEVRDFALELSQIERAAQQNKNLIAAKIGKIKSGIAAAEEYLSSELVGGADQLKAALKTFFAVASQTLQQTKDLFRDMEKDYQEIVEKFGESASSTSQFTDFFGYIHGFCNVFEAARKENQRQNLEDNKKPLTTVTQKIMMKLEMKKELEQVAQKEGVLGNLMVDIASGVFVEDKPKKKNKHLDVIRKSYRPKSVRMTQLLQPHIQKPQSRLVISKK